MGEAADRQDGLVIRDERGVPGGHLVRGGHGAHGAEASVARSPGTLSSVLAASVLSQ